MKRILLLSLFLSAPAFAGDQYLGTVTSSGVDAINTFVIPLNIRISVQCDAAAYFITDSASAITAANGIYLSQWLFFPSSVGSIVRQLVGGIPSAIVRVISVTGTANCKILRPQGNE